MSPVDQYAIETYSCFSPYIARNKKPCMVELRKNERLSEGSSMYDIEIVKNAALSYFWHDC